MVEYCEQYLKIYYENFKFFNPECQDRRVRETMMRTKYCMNCPGLDRCKMYPEFWLVGEIERMKMNEKLIKGGA
ncbi:MAG: hypothetical protein J7M18_03910 [Candidatus Eremiobacteraeota bacterium]|nr:hypothetical protein [Candidatus Eremiobacteraeota bacterium]